MRLAKGAVVAALAGGGLAALVAPHLHARREADFLRVEVTAPARAAEAGSTVTLRVRARNTHGGRRRVYTRWLDVSESLARAGTVLGVDGQARARWVPVARVWRVPFVEEIRPGEVRDLAVRITGAKPGRYDGAVDVVLGGTSWVRDEAGFEVVAVRSQSGSNKGD